MLGLTEYLHRKPGQLSGGQRQRVAMGRAMVRRPSVYLMDEPLSNLDAKLRVQMRSDIAGLQHELGVTTVYVTHDQSEAMTLGHRVAALADGKLQQFDTPDVMYRRPANLFVAGFIGSPSMNLVTLPFGDGGVCARLGVGAAPARGRAGALGAEADGDRRRRPPGVARDRDGGPRRAGVGRRDDRPRRARLLRRRDERRSEQKLVARAEAKNAPSRGERVTLQPDFSEAHFFDPATGERLGD